MTSEQRNKWIARAVWFFGIYLLNTVFIVISAGWQQEVKQAWLVAIAVSWFAEILGSPLAVAALFFLITSAIRLTGKQVGVRWLFIGGFLALGTLCFWVAAGELVTGLRSTTFPTVPGRILSSSVVTDTSTYRDDNKSRTRTETTYDFRVTYQYQVGEQSYRGTEYDISGGSLPEGLVADLAGQYPEGASATVYYDPWNPSTALLKPGLTGNWMLLLLAGGVFLFLAGGTFEFFKRNDKTRSGS